MQKNFTYGARVNDCRLGTKSKRTLRIVPMLTTAIGNQMQENCTYCAHVNDCRYGTKCKRTVHIVPMLMTADREPNAIGCPCYVQNSALPGVRGYTQNGSFHFSRACWEHGWLSWGTACELMTNCSCAKGTQLAELMNCLWHSALLCMCYGHIVELHN